MTGPEITWTGDAPPRRKRRPKSKRKWTPRPAIQNPPKPKPPTCTHPQCPEYPNAPALEGRSCCAVCFERLEARASEHRQRWST